MYEVYFLLKNGKVDGIMEEMFIVIEFIKRKRNLELLIVYFFEDKYGFGVVIKEDDFGFDVLYCLLSVLEFVFNDIYFNISVYFKFCIVSIKIFIVI